MMGGATDNGGSKALALISDMVWMALKLRVGKCRMSASTCVSRVHYKTVQNETSVH